MEITTFSINRDYSGFQLGNVFCVVAMQVIVLPLFLRNPRVKQLSYGTLWLTFCEVPLTIRIGVMVSKRHKSLVSFSGELIIDCPDDLL